MLFNSIQKRFLALAIAGVRVWQPVQIHPPVLTSIQPTADSSVRLSDRVRILKGNFFLGKSSRVYVRPFVRPSVAKAFVKMHEIGS